MKRFLCTLVIATAAAAAFAHGDAQPKHGGIVQSANDLSFELVKQANGAIIYVEDHGKPLATQGMGGKLTVLNGTQKSEADLQPAGENRLEAKGVKIAAGAKAVATVSAQGSKTATVRFTVK